MIWRWERRQRPSRFRYRRSFPRHSAGIRQLGLRERRLGLSAGLRCVPLRDKPCILRNDILRNDILRSDGGRILHGALPVHFQLPLQRLGKPDGGGPQAADGSVRGGSAGVYARLASRRVMRSWLHGRRLWLARTCLAIRADQRLPARIRRLRRPRLVARQDVQRLLPHHHTAGRRGENRQQTDGLLFAA